MVTTIIENDIPVFYVAADSFPQGITAAHERLHALIPFSKERRFFGISRPEDGKIVYKAAAEEINAGEAEKFHCKKMVLAKGKYVSLSLKDFAKDIQSVDRAFKELLSHPDIDPQGYCVELYTSPTDMICMVRLQSE